MKSFNKEDVQYLSAVLSLFIGFGLCIAGFCWNPTAEIHDSILWLMGQCFIFAGSVFGIKNYIDYKLPHQ